MALIDRAENFLRVLESAALVVLISAMTILSFSQVVLRDVFGKGIVGLDILLRYMVLWGGFLGAALAAAQGKHFAFEVLSAKAGRSGGAAKGLGLAAATAGSFALAWTARSFVLMERSSGGTLFALGGGGIPRWIFEIALPAGFGLVGLHFLLASARAFLKK